MTHQGHVLYKIENHFGMETLQVLVFTKKTSPSMGIMPDHIPGTRHTTATEAWVKDDHDVTMEGSWQDVIPVNDTRKYASHRNKVSL